MHIIPAGQALVACPKCKMTLNSCEHLQLREGFIKEWKCPTCGKLDITVGQVLGPCASCGILVDYGTKHCLRCGKRPVETWVKLVTAALIVFVLCIAAFLLYFLGSWIVSDDSSPGSKQATTHVNSPYSEQEDRRKQIFYDLVHAQDTMGDQAGGRYIMNKYDLTYEQCMDIISEGIRKNWPMP
jgi:hypothetical protein